MTTITPNAKKDSIANLPILGFLKENNQDFEWYPTTEEMLACVNSHVNERFSDRFFNEGQPRVSVLDCGAGDGRSLKSIASGGEMYAIEKSERLILAMSDDIYIVGTDFHSSTIIDKKVDVVFSNPPYSEFQEWSSKLIREANCAVVYLIVPTRWVDSIPIKEAIEAREAEAEILGTFDFLSAERKARAVVNVLAIDLTSGRGEYRRNKKPRVDPFSVWFDEYFAINADQSDNSSWKQEHSKQKLSETVQREIVNGRNLIQVLVELYNKEMQHLIKNYQAVGKLDSAILKELDVSVTGLKKGLEQKIVGLKAKFWTEFFNNYTQITARLTSASRNSMLKKLHENISIDFTESNALAVTVWAIKNANQYIDKQLIKMVESMIDQANISLYKSNMRVWGKEEWRYCHSGNGPDDLSHYGLELRVVLHRYCAIEGGGYGYSFDYKNGLHKDAHKFIGDLATIAGNLGFSVRSDSRLKQWESNKNQIFKAEDGSTVMQIKAFKNGNLHIRFNQLFIRKMNVEFGRLKGWLHSKEHAAEELNIPVDEIHDVFNCNHQIALSSVPQICAGDTVH